MLMSVATSTFIPSFHQYRPICVIVCLNFSESYIDGEELLTMTAVELTPTVPLGIARKIVRLIPNSESTQPINALNQSTVEDQGVPQDLELAPSNTSTPVQADSYQSTPSTSRPSTPSTSTISDPLVIPNHWRPEIEQNIQDQALSDSSCNEIVRTLVNMLFSQGRGKPNRSQCDNLARKLILKYPFAKDDMGTGYVSFDFLLLEVGAIMHSK